MKILGILKNYIKFSLIFISSCSYECVNYNYQNQFDYDVDITEITDNGIGVDRYNVNTTLGEIDKLTNQVEACLEIEFGNPPVIPENIMIEADCVSNTFSLPISRGCFTVKIPDDWELSCDGTQQLLPYDAPQQLCNNKGLIEDLNCPCKWRAGIQNRSIIVSTPNLYLYKDPLVRLATGCNNPWANEKLSKCAIK